MSEGAPVSQRWDLLRSSAAEALELKRFHKWDAERSFDKFISDELKDAETLAEVGDRDGTIVIMCPVSISINCHCTTFFASSTDTEVLVEAFKCWSYWRTCDPYIFSTTALAVGPKSVILGDEPAKFLNERGVHVECVGHGSDAERFWVQVCRSDAPVDIDLRGCRMSYNGRDVLFMSYEEWQALVDRLPREFKALASR